jgi:serine/threonine protein kinase
MKIARPLREALADKDLPAVVAAVRTIAHTLARLRAEHGLAHRDIKPANLYELDGEAVIGDFGLVALPDRKGLTKQGKALGPVNFTPFEMLNMPATADPFAADVYALAKTMWTLACGVDFPPPGHQPGSAAPHITASHK